MDDWKTIIVEMKEDSNLKDMWDNYSEKNIFAQKITYDMVMGTISSVGEVLIKDSW